MRNLHKALMIATLILGAPLLSHASTWSCPPVLSEPGTTYACQFANHRPRAVDATFTFYSSNGTILGSPTVTVEPNHAALISGGIGHSGPLSCTITFRGSKKNTSASTRNRVPGFTEYGAACQ